jgi:hypothetical protein
MDKESSRFTYTLNRKQLRQIRRREGRYLLRTDLTESDSALLWEAATAVEPCDGAFDNPAFGFDDKPLARSERLTISTTRLRIALAAPSRKTGPV